MGGGMKWMDDWVDGEIRESKSRCGWMQQVGK